MGMHSTGASPSRYTHCITFHRPVETLPVPAQGSALTINRKLDNHGEPRCPSSLLSLPSKICLSGAQLVRSGTHAQ
jgi:hypothetical protein